MTAIAKGTCDVCRDTALCAGFTKTIGDSDIDVLICESCAMEMGKEIDIKRRTLDVEERRKDRDAFSEIIKLYEAHPERSISRVIEDFRAAYRWAQSRIPKGTVIAP